MDVYSVTHNVIYNANNAISQRKWNILSDANNCSSEYEKKAFFVGQICKIFVN